MSDPSSTETPRPGPDAVRRSLRALTDGSTPERRRARAESGLDDSAPASASASTETGASGATSTDTTAHPPPESPDAPSAPPPESVVREAERAAEDAQVAAVFLLAGRLQELDVAITTATTRGEVALAARGRAARHPLRRLDAVLEG